uniref:Secreted protein n=1 Tax=Strongyloides venezuelensis TaxID=75913 RepID=A0A0K0FNT7_STRVS
MIAFSTLVLLILIVTTSFEYKFTECDKHFNSSCTDYMSFLEDTSKYNFTLLLDPMTAMAFDFCPTTFGVGTLTTKSKNSTSPEVATTIDIITNSTITSLRSARTMLISR